MLRTVIKYCATFVLAVLILTALLIGVAKIPISSIQENMLKSGEYFNSKEQAEYLTEGVLASQIHYSADATWCSIAYNLDPDHPLESAMWANFSLWEGENYNGGFYQSVLNRAPGELVQYLRYWHGPAAILRLLHLFLNIQQIYILMSGLLSFLIAALLIILIRNHLVPEAVAFLVSMFMVSIWIVPLCLEYVWMFLVMLVAAIVGVRMSLKGNHQNCGTLFFMTGIIVAYLDFLTTETVTLLIPLLLILRIRGGQHTNAKSDWMLIFKSGFVWLVGYVGMWAMKWVIASIVLKQNIMPYVTWHIEERIGGDAGLTLPEYLLQVISRNVGRLFVFDYGLAGAMTLLGLIILLVFIPVWKNWISVKTQINWSRVMLFVSLGLVPYIRYLILHNHSYGHYCFTYRAQAASVMALCFLIMEFLDIHLKREADYPRKRCADQRNKRP